MTELTKYPRTVHLPNSGGKTDDDLTIRDSSYLHLSKMKDFVVTEKMDGGNLTMTRNHFFARSLDSGTHLWDTYARGMWASLRWNIPEGWRVSGESLYARRSVPYDNLEAYYLVYGIWDAEDNLIDWDTTVLAAEAWGFKMVPLLYRGPSFIDAMEAWETVCDPETSEGFVIRNAKMIRAGTLAMYSERAKWVRPNHVQTRDDWRHRTDFEVNGLKK